MLEKCHFEIKASKFRHVAMSIRIFRAEYWPHLYQEDTNEQTILHIISDAPVKIRMMAHLEHPLQISHERHLLVQLR